ncbi:uncharacterized protein [Physcomitrium patens]|uniref:Bet v I/Major latex protein domain-containing protein n=1 Tax=Physcomitrium patens TaxID=3218 RepID=A0A2K1KD42_PHYPA|nr:uncharacterized protein LOC112284283 [Physcomitrium patens]PNR51691.1 hypothetical protein PHYPA_010879 [Physcomitrium patens]|eukprot:XP_024379738.1 uncharacterized protein LOC112284283 [Physcomitrella patens]
MSGLMLNCGLSSNYQSYHFNSMLPMLVRRLGSMASNIAAEDNWHGAIEVVISAPVEKVWAIASDWLKFPRRCSVECAEGENGVPGCVRKVQAHNSSFWVAEKLTEIDHDKRFLTYDLVGGNTGIEIGYRAAFQVIDEGESRTRVVWPFMFSPEQVSVESLISVVKKKVKAHIKELEQLAQDA